MDGFLAEKKVAVTGRFASMTHAELAQLVAAYGGQFLTCPNRTTALFVLGQEGWPLDRDGRPTQNLEKARKLRALGYPIELVSEEDFLERIGLMDRQADVHRQYTVAQLSRILGVPGARIRTWMRAGLIEPVEVVHRLAYFDFQQVASAKTLCELALGGVTLQRIREGLEQLRQWLPSIDRPLSQINILERNGRLLLRLSGGQLAEPSGQFQLEFMTAGDEPQTCGLERTADEWFEEALALEDAGQPGDAALAYRQAIVLEPGDSVLYFNLGNVLYAQGDVEGGVDEFARAVGVEPHYAEAWNNLGSALAELGRDAEAVDALEQALRLVPAYADAHYNLADVLSRLERPAEASRHWQAYLRYDPHSPFSDDVRRRLAACGLDAVEVRS
ncbi:MAG: tetratricopeptide repeat protein [Pirellulales bacterium]